MRRDTKLIISQHVAPTKSATPPFLTKLLIFVCRPIAVIATIMRNLESSFKEEKKLGDRPKKVATVVMNDARRNHKIKDGTDVVTEVCGFELSCFLE